MCSIPLYVPASYHYLLFLYPVAFDLYPLAPIASRSEYSHPSVTTVHNLTIQPEFKNDLTQI
ncbi:hypothetical protein CROQUDRAFT_663971 [Cronartium quercuum f. sp. fusiforme G11]|uniref:Uncharacterized protein n=1 Tax=Cronartium quercuum f. sp. fusiforme G11 TaxID=708437 RepID=A0A9P6N810_9BASI|nr:hypothetical protein CROQUDRAFT_663971 [Cronartium quercuum f. sp. fusiforme G11]